MYLRKELNGSKIMHEAISILFGSNLPNLKNEEKMLSHSIHNAFEVSQASFLKSGPVNEFSCNKSVAFVASQLSCVSEVHQRRCTAGIRPYHTLE